MVITCANRRSSSTASGGIFMVWMLVVVVVISVVAKATDDAQLAKDKQECAPQLMGLSPCLTYVQGNAKTPTPDCCSGLKDVLKTSKKCLCLLVKYKDDPNIGIKIDSNLALGLPNVCHVPANISECPDLLHLKSNSPEAKLFYEFDKNSTSAATPSGNTTHSSSGSSGSSSSSSNATASDGGEGLRRAETVMVTVQALLLAMVSAFLLSSA